MIPNSCIKIETRKFPVLDGEPDEIVNQNMYGKALCLYLEKELPRIGLNVAFYCNEDWGWWLEVADGEFKMALCIYSDPDATGDPERYALIPSITVEKKWSWSKFRNLDVGKDVLKVIDSLESLFRKDREISAVSRHDDFPFE